MVIERFQIWFVDLENNTSQLCVIVSPSELSALDTVIVAPMSSKLKAYPSRVACHFRGVDGVIALDQIKAVDRSRLRVQRSW
jgi:mRNA interferase MazF